MNLFIRYSPIPLFFFTGVLFWQDSSLSNYENYWISGADLNFPIDTAERVLRRLEVLDWSIGFGTDRANNLTTVPLWTLHWIFTKIPTVTGPQSVIIYSCLIISLAYISFLRLITLLLEIDGFNFDSESRNEHIILSLAATAYALCPYTFYLFSRLNTHSYIIFFTPFLLALFIKLIVDRQLDFFDKFVFCLSLILWFPLFSIQPPLLLTLVLFITLFCLLTYFRPKRFFCISMSMVFIICIFSVWWVVPYLNFLLNSGFLNSSDFKEQFDFFSLVKYSSSCSQIWNVITGFADTSWCQDHSYPHFPILNQIQNSLFHISLLLVSTILGIIFLLTVKSTFKKPLLICGVLFLILSAGTTPPFGNLFLYVFSEVPYLSMYRAPWMKFGFVFYLVEYLVFAYALISLYRLRFNK